MELIRLNCTCNVARRRGGDGSGGGLLLFPAENEVQGERDDDERERAACLPAVASSLFPPPARPSFFHPFHFLSSKSISSGALRSTKLQKSIIATPPWVKKDSQMDCPFPINGSGTHQTITLFFEPAALQW